MAASYPDAIFEWTDRVDGTDDVLAADVNSLAAEVIAAETALMTPTATIKGRKTAETGKMEDLTAADVRTLLNVSDGANAYVHPNHSGDVTSVGDGAQTIAANAVTETKIANKAVTLAKMADMTTASLLGRKTAAAGVPEVLSKTDVLTVLNLAAYRYGYDKYGFFVPYGTFEKPGDFKPVLPCDFYIDSAGVITHDMDFTTRYKSGTAIYVKATGNDTTGDGSAATPYATVTKAVQVVIAAASGSYIIYTDIAAFNRDQFIFTQTLTDKTLAIVSTAVSPTVVSTSAVYGWTEDGEGTYKASRTEAYGVLDNLNRDIYGLPVTLTKVATLVACQGAVGTWYTDNTYVWVHRSDEILPTVTNTLVAIAVSFIDPVLSNSKLYLENFIFCGWANGNALRIRGTAATLTDELCVNNCFFSSCNQSTSGNGLATDAVKTVYVFNSIAAYAQLDGFNYHFTDVAAGSVRDCLVLEVNCRAYHLGIEIPGSQSNNASSAHEGVSVLRFGTIGEYNSGATITDVTGCYSILIGCDASNPVLDGVEGDGTAYQFTSDGAGEGLGKTIMINCKASDCVDALSVGTTHKAYLYGFVYEGSIGGAGTIIYMADVPQA